MSYHVDDFDGEVCDVWKEHRPRANKPHKCDACGETIIAGTTYNRISMVWDGTAETVKRCQRCEAIYKHLCEKGGREFVPDVRLDCGHEYKEQWGEEPPADIAALAFVLPHEIKAGTQ